MGVFKLTNKGGTSLLQACIYGPLVRNGVSVVQGQDKCLLAIHTLTDNVIYQQDKHHIRLKLCDYKYSSGGPGRAIKATQIVLNRLQSYH